MKKHFLLLFLMALMPFVAWGHNASWADASTIKEIVSANLARPTFNNNYLTVTNSYNGGSCSYGSFSASYPTGNNNRYNVSIHASESDANTGSNPITVSPLEKGNYYLRVWIRGRTGGTIIPQYGNDFEVLPFQMIQKVTVTLSDFAQDWGSAEPTIATLPATAHTQDVSTWDAIDDYLTFYRENTSTDAGSYDYTLNVDATAAKAAFYEVAIAAGTPKYTINPVPATSSLTFKPEVGLTYNGVAQALVTWEGTYAGGDLVFSVDGENWDKDFYKQVNAGDYTLSYKIVGDKNHTDTQAQEIGTISIAKAAIGYQLGNAEDTYDGHAWTPLELAMYSQMSGSFAPGENLANLGISFEFPKEIKDAGEYTINKLNVVYPLGAPQNYNFIFSFTSNITILQKDFAGVTITGTETATWTGKVQDPEWTVTDGDPSIITTDDYAVVIKDEDGNVVNPNGVIEVGEYTYTFTPTEDGNYKGAAIEKTFNIVGIELTESMLQGTWVDEVIYDGENHAPAAYILKDGKYVLTADDYEVVITNTEIDSKTGNAKVVTEAVNADEYTFTFTGKGHYAGSFTKTLTINPKTITADDIVMSETTVYNAEPQYPEVTTKLTDDDVEVSVNTGDVDNVVNAGNYTYTFKGKGNYTGSVTKPFEITRATIQISIVADLHRDYNGESGLDGLVPEFEYSGLQGADDADNIEYRHTTYNPAYRVVNASANVGEYALSINAGRFRGKSGSTIAGNYDFVVNEEITRSLVIDAIDLTITFIDHPAGDPETYLLNKNYGAADNFNTNAWKNAHLELDGNIASEANAIRQGLNVVRAESFVGKEDAGKYGNALELEELLGATVFDNYNVDITDKGDFEILNNRVLEVTLKEDVKTIYDGKAKTVTFESLEDAKGKLAVSGYVGEDNFETMFTAVPTVTIEGTAAGTLVDGKAINYGEYAIVLSGDVAPNYTINYTNARLYIDKKEITAEVAVQSVKQGATSKDLNQKAFTIEGAIEGDDLKAELVINEGEKPAANVDEPGTYTEGIELLIGNENYILSPVHTYGTLIVVDGDDTIVLTPYSRSEYEADDHIGWAQEAAIKDAATDPYGNVRTVKFGGGFTMNKGHWYTFVLPFKTNVMEVMGAFDQYISIELLDKANSGKGVAKFKLIGGEIKANQPFLIQIYEDKNLDEVEFKDKAIEYAANPQDVDDDSKTRLVGTYKGIKGYGEGEEFVKGKQWYMAISTGVWHSSPDGYTRPTGAFLDIDMDGVAGAPVIYIEDPETGTTGIMEMDVEKQALSTEGWYTVSGVKLQGAPTQKGVYIKDGKKVIIK